eukprot:TRINITY_DN1524_c1_g3_i1.p1 TRINITY_DN1524_c1_g3~~TRINITY_DN1524_c1_g3_i1.p1  ORF type:complete len:742 (+),score=152.45 TRINITY_DN1524_c1_g3_i1:29-2227(+)
MYETGWDAGNAVSFDDTVRETTVAKSRAQTQFYDFLRLYQRENMFVYRDQLTKQYGLGKYYIEVDLADLHIYSDTLASQIREQPAAYLVLFEAAAKSCIAEFRSIPEEDAPNIQIILISDDRTLSIRDVQASYSKFISRLVQVPGIVISMSRVQSKATALGVVCKGCGSQRTLPVKPGFGGAELPKYCDQPKGAEGGKKCPNNPFVIVPDLTVFMDQQVLKLQEKPESVPTGEMPRALDLILDRNLVEKVVPGTRVSVTGIVTVFRTAPSAEVGAAHIQRTYLQVVGVSADSSDNGRSSEQYTVQEVQEFQTLAKRPDIYSQIVDSLAPDIYGHVDIKKAAACQLFGGCRKALPDGMKLRGDINILLLGDPGTAKSQMLKFVSQASPISVYTSGKGSSAAGLTAVVKREGKSREFFLEGGAMVLADKGIVCIDEFDKMRVQDRVAIHEAMEQQTISIAKAGITTILNSRTAVLAAANPNFGSYDEMRSASENFEEFRTTILSRFDCIFLIKDKRTEENDMRIGKHVTNIHKYAMHRTFNETPAQIAQSEAQSNAPIPLLTLKRYISYCKSKCEPRLSEEASEVLINKYVQMRSKHRERESTGSNAIPITVRQLEAVIRISEALAKMSLSPVANKDHVEEALRLFNVSTIDAINSGQIMTETISDKAREELEQIERVVKSRVARGSHVSIVKLVEYVTSHYSMPENMIRRTLDIMAQRGDLTYTKMGKVVKRN